MKRNFIGPIVHVPDHHVTGMTWVSLKLLMRTCAPVLIFFSVLSCLTAWSHEGRAIYQNLLGLEVPEKCHRKHFQQNISFDEEMLTTVLSHCDPLGLWNFGLVNKWFFSFVRDFKSGLNLAWESDKSLRMILIYSQLPIPDYTWNFIQKDMRSLLPPLGIRDIEILFSADVIARDNIVRGFLTRKVGVFVAQNIIRMSSNYPLQNFFPLLDTRCIYVEPGSEKYKEPYYNYIPIETNKKLFDYIDPSLIAAAMNAGITGQERLFSCAIFADYIIPSFNGKYELTERERTILASLFPTLRNGVFQIVGQMHWMFYLSEGTTDKNKCSEIRDTQKYFKGISWIWKEMKVNQRIRSSFNLLVRNRKYPDMMGIFWFAKWWKFDIVKIATNTKEWCAISKDILAGKYPEELISVKLPTTMELFESMNGTGAMTYNQYELLRPAGMWVKDDRPTRLRLPLTDIKTTAFRPERVRLKKPKDQKPKETDNSTTTKRPSTSSKATSIPAKKRKVTPSVPQTFAQNQSADHLSIALNPSLPLIDIKLKLQSMTKDQVMESENEIGTNSTFSDIDSNWECLLDPCLLDLFTNDDLMSSL